MTQSNLLHELLSKCASSDCKLTVENTKDILSSDAFSQIVQQCINSVDLNCMFTEQEQSTTKSNTTNDGDGKTAKGIFCRKINKQDVNRIDYSKIELLNSRMKLYGTTSLQINEDSDDSSTVNFGLGIKPSRSFSTSRVLKLHIDTKLKKGNVKNDTETFTKEYRDLINGCNDESLKNELELHLADLLEHSNDTKKESVKSKSFGDWIVSLVTDGGSNNSMDKLTGVNGYTGPSVTDELKEAGDYYASNFLELTVAQIESLLLYVIDGLLSAMQPVIAAITPGSVKIPSQDENLDVFTEEEVDNKSGTSNTSKTTKLGKDKIKWENTELSYIINEFLNEVDINIFAGLLMASDMFNYIVEYIFSSNYTVADLIQSMSSAIMDGIEDMKDILNGDTVDVSLQKETANETVQCGGEFLEDLKQCDAEGCDADEALQNKSWGSLNWTPNFGVSANLDADTKYLEASFQGMKDAIDTKTTPFSDHDIDKYIDEFKLTIFVAYNKLLDTYKANKNGPANIKYDLKMKQLQYSKFVTNDRHVFPDLAELIAIPMDDVIYQIDSISSNEVLLQAMSPMMNILSDGDAMAKNYFELVDAALNKLKSDMVSLKINRRSKHYWSRHFIIFGFDKIQQKITEFLNQMKHTNITLSMLQSFVSYCQSNYNSLRRHISKFKSQKDIDNVFLYIYAKNADIRDYMTQAFQRISNSTFGINITWNSAIDFTREYMQNKSGLSIDTMEWNDEMRSFYMYNNITDIDEDDSEEALEEMDIFKHYEKIRDSNPLTIANLKTELNNLAILIDGNNDIESITNAIVKISEWYGIPCYKIDEYVHKNGYKNYFEEKIQSKGATTENGKVVYRFAPMDLLISWLFNIEISGKKVGEHLIEGMSLFSPSIDNDSSDADKNAVDNTIAKLAHTTGPIANVMMLTLFAVLMFTQSDKAELYSCFASMLLLIRPTFVFDHATQTTVLELGLNVPGATDFKLNVYTTQPTEKCMSRYLNGISDTPEEGVSSKSSDGFVSGTIDQITREFSTANLWGMNYLLNKVTTIPISFRFVRAKQSNGKYKLAAKFNGPIFDSKKKDNAVLEHAFNRELGMSQSRIKPAFVGNAINWGKMHLQDMNPYERKYFVGAYENGDYDWDLPTKKTGGYITSCNAWYPNDCQWVKNKNHNPNSIEKLERPFGLRIGFGISVNLDMFSGIKLFQPNENSPGIFVNPSFSLVNQHSYIGMPKDSQLLKQCNLQVIASNVFNTCAIPIMGAMGTSEQGEGEDAEITVTQYNVDTVSS